VSERDSGGRRGPEQDSPRATLGRMIHGYRDTQLVYIAARLGIPDLLSAGPASAATLADAIGADADALRRVLRALASNGVVAEDVDGRFRLTPLGEPLRAGVPGSLREAALLNGAVDYPAFGALLDALRAEQTPFVRVFGTDFFDYLTRDDDLGDVFNRFMARVTTRMAAAALEAYDLSPIHTVVDVGGGYGTLLAAILTARPHIHGTLLETSAVAPRARRYIAEAGLADRCAVVEGDFFTAVPAGGDAYLLSQILHDWDDERCLRVLARCRQAINEGGRLLVVEQLLPDRVEGRAPVVESDLYMLALTGGRERTVGAYRALFAAASFDLARVIPTRTHWTILEGLPR